MKHYQPFISRLNSMLSKKQQAGFALIATISIMALLVIIVLAMLNLSVIEQRSSRQSKAVMEAQANARMALEIAIGELQKNAGPDQRVTAEAAILEDPEGNSSVANRHWVGVWRTDGLKGEDSTGVTPIIYRNTDTSGSEAGSLFDRRSDGSYQAKDQSLTWLVSHHGSPDPTVSLPSDDSVLLVGSGSTYESKDRVRASRIAISNDGRETGGFAWWIGDEGVKSRFNLAGATSGHAKEQPWQVVEQSGINILEGYEQYESVENPEIEKTITRNSADISGASSSQTAARDARLKSFHDITFSSAGLLTDTFRGGLRRDLSAFLANGAVPDLGGRKGLQLSDSILDSDKLRELSAKFSLLYDWNNLGKNLSASGGVDPIAPKNLANGTVWGWNTRNPGETAIESGIDISKLDSPPIHPIMIDAGISYGFSLTENGSSAGGVTPYRLNIHYFPRVVLWNPYNVKINAAKYVAQIHMPHLFDVTVLYPGGADQNHSLFEASFQGYGGENSPFRPHFSIPSTSFEPGEALLFTANGGGALHGNKYWGDPDSAIAGSLSNFELSCRKVPPLTDSYYMRTSKIVQIPDSELNNATFQVFARLNNKYKNFVYRLYLNRGNVDTIAGLDTAHTSFLPLQHIIQTEDGTSGSDAPAFSGIPASSSSPLHLLADEPAAAFYRFKWGHRMQWVEDTDENQTIKPGYYDTPYLGYNTLANHSMRAGWHVRSPVEVAFRASAVAGRYTHGISIDDPYGWDWEDSSLEPVPSGGNNRVSPFGRAANYGGQTFPLLDIPKQESPLISLGALQHTPLSQFPWHPTYAVGNSLADPRVARDQTTNFVSSSEWGLIGVHGDRKKWDGIRQAHVTSALDDASFLYDLSYEMNFTLWDNYFLSTVESDYALGDTLKNPRLILSTENTQSTVADLKDFHQAAKHFMVKGAFNVNSTSEKAWAALFASFRSNTGMSVTLQDGSKLEANDIYSRLLTPYDKLYDGNGPEEEETWVGYRQLTDDQIRTLAKEIVKEVKQRGPFISLADFINRRLVEPPEQSGTETEHSRTGLKGALQAAIDRTNINQEHLSAYPIPKTEYHMGSGPDHQVKYGNDYPTVSFPVKNGSSGHGPKPDHNHWATSKLVGAPSYLTQADMLQKFGSVLSARSDTFVIRTYGESRDENGKVQAKAWCEAIVQRTQAPILADDQGLDPHPDITANPAAAMGRRFKIVSFRWLNSNEV